MNPITWAECERCSGALLGPVDEQGRLYDGDEATCTECGLVHQVTADEDGAEMVAVDGWDR